jgi:hypothetical protein
MGNPLASLASSPFAPYYNLDGLTDVFLTADVDWAPDYAIDHLLRAVEARKMKLTIFATGKSASLQKPPDWLEVGLHPDFTRKTGPWIDERMAALKALYPEAVGMRSHRNYFGQNIADLAHANGLLYDASNILFNQPYTQAHVDYNSMIRFSYMWEDGLHLDMKYGLDLSRVTLESPGLKIINAHPVLFYLNSVSDDHRRKVTRRYSDLTTALKADIDPERNTGRGIGTVWLEMLDDFAKRGIRTHCLRDAVMAARLRKAA